MLQNWRTADLTYTGIDTHWTWYTLYFTYIGADAHWASHAPGLVHTVHDILRNWYIAWYSSEHTLEPCVRVD